MKTENGTKNPILKILKENDIVLVELPSDMRVNYFQICKIYNLKYTPSNDEFDFDWLDFNTEVLYVNWRVHPTLINQCIGNCLAITEVIPVELIETFVVQYRMWKPEEYPLSDAELERNSIRFIN